MMKLTINQLQHPGNFLGPRLSRSSREQENGKAVLGRSRAARCLARRLYKLRRVDLPKYFCLISQCDFQAADAVLVASPSLLHHYRPLYDWLKERPGRVGGIHIAFGPGDTFFACDVLGKRIKSSQTIPQNLRDVLALNPRKNPAKVALGINDSYFLLWSDGEYKWNLRQQYQQLEQILRDAKRDGKPVKVRRTQYFGFACIDLTM
jgi:hypothetical protein